MPMWPIRAQRLTIQARLIVYTKKAKMMYDHEHECVCHNMAQMEKKVVDWIESASVRPIIRASFVAEPTSG